MDVFGPADIFAASPSNHGLWQTIQVPILTLVSFVAACLNWHAAIRGARRTIVISAIRAFLATFYFGGYLWLNWHLNDRAEWSEFMSGPGVLSWVVVWIYPAMFAYKGRLFLTEFRGEDDHA